MMRTGEVPQGIDMLVQDFSRERLARFSVFDGLNRYLSVDATVKDKKQVDGKAAVLDRWLSGDSRDEGGEVMGRGLFAELWARDVLRVLLGGKQWSAYRVRLTPHAWDEMPGTRGSDIFITNRGKNGDQLLILFDVNLGERKSTVCTTPMNTTLQAPVVELRLANLHVDRMMDVLTRTQEILENAVRVLNRRIRGFA